MSNIYVEAKGPQGPQIKESLQLASVPASPSRGLAVVYNTDAFHIALTGAAATASLGILEEDAVVVVRGGASVVGEPNAVIEFGQAVAQIGANVTAGQLLTTDSSSRLVPATAGQPVVAVSLEAQTYVSPGSFACVFVFGLFGFSAPVSPTTYYTASGAIAVASGIAVLNGSGALAMTLATPTTPAQDGTKLTIVALTAHAHTVTTAADIIDGADDKVTYAAIGDIVELLAVGGKWMVLSIGGPTPAALSEV